MRLDSGSPTGTGNSMQAITPSRAGNSSKASTVPAPERRAPVFNRPSANAFNRHLPGLLQLNRLFMMYLAVSLIGKRAGGCVTQTYYRIS
jgi:hypothetical protein